MSNEHSGSHPMNRRDWLKAAGVAASISSVSYAAGVPLTLQAFEPNGSPCSADRLRTISLADQESRPYPVSFPRAAC